MGVETGSTLDVRGRFRGGTEMLSPAATAIRRAFERNLPSDARTVFLPFNPGTESDLMLEL